MVIRTLAFFTAACLIPLAGPIDATAQETDPEPGQPNIVVFYFDDAGPHDGRLWGASDDLGHDPTLTPSIYEHFVENGVEFTNAIVENPLCCPARGNFLTGLHTHNQGLVDNDARLLDPAVHIGKAMQDTGYASMYIGKHMNWNHLLTAAEWQEHQAGWTHMDTIVGINGDFWGYTLKTKEGDQYLAAYHSTQMVGDRAVMRLRETDPNQPVFAVLSIYNLHGPNAPLPEFKNAEQCADMPPWKPPNYNELDVSDKPEFVQALPLQPYADGWPMDKYCREMLGIDKIVGQVTDELQAQGRLDNTLLVFTADNGIGWGQHRVGQQKILPYTTPVPLYMSWPARWGDVGPQVSEHTTNIDLAPTFCELAGTDCQLTGYPLGQTAPDGVSLVPLLDGDVTDLGRAGLLEVSFLGTGSGRRWEAIRTTAQHDLYSPAGDLWHYVEHWNGELELYNLRTDPWELESVAHLPDNATIVDRLADDLDGLRSEGLVQQIGSVRIVQSRFPAGVEDFAYTSDLGDFALDKDSDPALPDQQMFARIPPGTYTFTQDVNAPLPLSSILCTEPATVDVAQRTVTLQLPANIRVTCTFTNSEPPPAGSQPDASVALTSAGPFKADDLYQATPTKKQRVKRKRVQRGVTYDYLVNIENDGVGSDSFNVRGATDGSVRMKVSYFAGAVDITGQVAAGSYTIPDLPPGASTQVVVRIKVGARARVGHRMKVDVTVTSAGDPTLVDSVRAVAVR